VTSITDHDEVRKTLEVVPLSAHGMLPLNVYAEIYEQGRKSQGGLFVEVGTAHGAGTIALALGAKEQKSPFHIFTVGMFSGQYSSRTQFGSVADNVVFVRSQLEKFDVQDQVTIVPGTIVDLLASHNIKGIDLLMLDADGCIDRELSPLFGKLSPNCPIIIDDIDDLIVVSKANGRPFLDQKHRLTYLLIKILVERGVLREERRIHNTGFFRKGPATVDSTTNFVRGIACLPRTGFCQNRPPADPHAAHVQRLGRRQHADGTTFVLASEALAGREMKIRIRRRR